MQEFKKYQGTWHIYEMEQWDAAYFNMEVQAYLELNVSGGGDFQWGLVSGQIDGEIATWGGEERFEFTWDGNDECDDAAGSGWVKLTDEDNIQGKFKFHDGDSSEFLARRADADK